MTSIAASPREVLENGHTSSTPPGDNLVLDFARGQAEGIGALIAAAGGRVSYDDEFGVHLRDAGIPTPFGNAALLGRPTPDGNVAGLVEVLADFFQGRPGGPYLLFSAWPLANLAPYGFAPVGHPPLMFRPAGGSAPLASGLRIVAVSNPDELADFEQTLIEAYPIPEMLPWERDSYLRAPVLDTRWRFFLGYENGRPVATAAAYITSEVTIVELVSARPECRGLGYGAALTAAASLAAPDKPAMLVASDLGRGVYTRLGYLPVLRYTLWLGLR